LLIGTSDSAEEDYQAITYQRPLILLMGSERHGLSPQMSLSCDQMVRIPMVGRSDSLNLAVATAVTLYEIFNQFRKSEGVK
jgi:TrmH family RNA methyltransferase